MKGKKFAKNQSLLFITVIKHDPCRERNYTKQSAKKIWNK